MSRVFKRFDIYSEAAGYRGLEREDDAEGEYVLAQDAYDAVAVLEAQISVLKTQLKDLKQK